MDIVVARYNENLDWLRPFMSDAIIYNKGPSEEALEASWVSHGARVEHLPNVGRESNTYLSHIVENYDDGLADWTVFVQGNPFDHCQDIRRNLVTCDRESGMSPNYTRRLANLYWLCEEFKIAEWGGHVNEPYPGNFRDFWNRFIRVPFPPDKFLNVYFGANFAVSKSRILCRPKSDYEEMLQTVMTPNPEAGHFLERSWSYLFT